MIKPLEVMVKTRIHRPYGWQYRRDIGGFPEFSEAIRVIATADADSPLLTLERFKDFFSEGQGRNLALTVLYVPCLT